MMGQNTFYWILETQSANGLLTLNQAVCRRQVRATDGTCPACPACPACPGKFYTTTPFTQSKAQVCLVTTRQIDAPCFEVMDAAGIQLSILGALRNEIQQGILGALRNEIQQGILGALRNEIQQGILGALHDEKEQPVAEVPAQRILGALRKEQEQPNAA